ncbi:MAG: Dyp-type peroxidase [Alphaproteobacteria bacterium]
MTRPQNAIFIEGSQFYLALEYCCTASPQLKAALQTARDLAAAAADAHVVFALGSTLLGALSGGQLKDFSAITGLGGLTAPATQRDLLIWIHGPGADANFDLGRAIHNVLKPHGELMLEAPGFTYRENRDMTGFIDGTANPKDAEALEAALIPEGRENAGGAYVISMQYVHDLDAFHKMPVREQENVIGRAKPDSTEMESAVKPKDAHIARAEVTEDGVEQKIYRRSFPYGGVQLHGLYFLAFACEQHRFEAILNSMYGLTGDGLHDRLLDYTRAVTGSYWFAPSREALDTMLR